MKTSVIALLTDFGEEDFFVGSLKGVIATINPSVPMVDITHHVPSFDVLAGGFILYAAYRYYPSGSIFLAIVDPGVGTARKILLVETENYMFIGPDNGVLSLALEAESTKTLIDVKNAKYFLPVPSSTFEGRDKMAPVAAWLSKGIAPSEFGPRVSDYVRVEVQKSQVGKEEILGQILYVDKFGNCITNIPAEEVRRIEDETREKRLVCQLGNKDIARFEQSYSFVSQDELFVLPGSLGLIEIAVREGSAQERLAAHPGDRVRIFLE
jgi:S-adenosylmethionine hydrolase